MRILNIFFIQLINYLTKCGVSTGEVFTAPMELESLFSLQKLVVIEIKSYLKNEEIRLHEVREGLKSYLRHNTEPNELNFKAHPQFNPIDLFVVIKGLLDIEKILSLTSNNKTHENFVNKIYLHNSKFPTDEDLNGAATVLNRLQQTYQLQTEAISIGVINHHCCAFPLTVDDCFELGRQSYYANDYNYTMQWMKQALKQRQYNENITSAQANAQKYENRSVVTEAEILEYIHWAKEIENSLIMADHFFSQTAQMDFQTYVDQFYEEDSKQTPERRVFPFDKSKYQALCRGENRAKSSTSAELKCYYISNGVAFLMIGPLKQEIVYFNPEIVVFHDVLYDEEISVIKKLAQPKFCTATVINHNTGGSVKSSVRDSKCAWLDEDDHPVVSKVNKRIEIITGLGMQTAEPLQVANYGVGGHYEPHYDFTYGDNLDNFMTEEVGNRVATLLFYMNDVQSGGATVFPSLDLGIWPRKGSAAFWYNLMHDGEGDFRTGHAACPVLLGTKWVSNKWIHERDQEFRRPCLSKQNIFI